MKAENLKIGRTYYMPAKYNPTSYTYGDLIAITEDRKAVLVNKKGEQLTVSPNKLHTRADKAVRRIDIMMTTDKAYDKFYKLFNQIESDLSPSEQYELYKDMESEIAYKRQRAYADIHEY